MFTQAREKVEENQRNEKSSLSISRCCGVWLDPQTRQPRVFIKKYMKEVDHLRKVIIKKQLHD